MSSLRSTRRRPRALAIAAFACAGSVLLATAQAHAAPTVSTDLNPGTIGAPLTVTGADLASLTPVSVNLQTLSAAVANRNGQSISITPKAGAKIGWAEGKLAIASGTDVSVTVSGLPVSSPPGFYLSTAKHMDTLNTPAVGGFEMSGNNTTAAWLTNSGITGAEVIGIPNSGTVTFDLTVVGADDSFNCNNVSQAPNGCDLTLRVDHRQPGNRAYDVKLPLKFVTSPSNIPTTAFGTGVTNADGQAMITANLPAGLGAGQHSVTMTGPGINVSTTVEISTPFWDYQSGQFFTDIAWLRGMGITTGNAKGEFVPAGPVTRQAMATFLYRLHVKLGGATTPACTSAPFPDVPKSHPFCREIKWLKGSGITGGYADGKFKPAGTVSRQAMAAFLYRFADLDTPAAACTSAPFLDVPKSAPFCREIKWMKSTGISTGSNGKFSPTANVSRQAMSAFLHRFYSL